MSKAPSAAHRAAASFDAHTFDAHTFDAHTFYAHTLYAETFYASTAAIFPAKTSHLITSTAKKTTRLLVQFSAKRQSAEGPLAHLARYFSFFLFILFILRGMFSPSLLSRCGVAVSDRLRYQMG